MLEAGLLEARQSCTWTWNYKNTTQSGVSKTPTCRHKIHKLDGCANVLQISGMTLGAFGGVAGFFALFFFSDIPRVRRDIMIVSFGVGSMAMRS
jgi:hypothetical protein